jgi:hypothetical protein
MAINSPNSSSDLQANARSELAAEPAAPAPAQGPPEEQTMPDFGIPHMVARSREAFLRDLPRLLEVRPREWVAYHGDDQLGFAKTRTELYQACLRRGLRREEFLVCSIEPQIETMTVRPELLG